MPLADNYIEAMEAVILDPTMKWDDVAVIAGVSVRQLHRIRKTPEWEQEYERRDKDAVIRSLRKAVMDKRDASLFKLYFQLTSTFDDEASVRLLKMSEDDEKKILKHAHDYYREQYGTRGREAQAA